MATSLSVLIAGRDQTKRPIICVSLHAQCVTGTRRVSENPLFIVSLVIYCFQTLIAMNTISRPTSAVSRSLAKNATLQCQRRKQKLMLVTVTTVKIVD